MVSKVYELSFKGEAGKALRAAFPEFDVTASSGVTVLRGRLSDPAALHGALERIESLGLELTDLHVIDDAARPPDVSG